MKLIMVFALACLVASSAFAVTDSGVPMGDPGTGHGVDGTGDAGLTTQFASNNNFAGNSFDITATQQITIAGFDINQAANLAQYTIDVYYRTGTCNGYETSAAGWTLLGSEVVTPAGVDVPTHVDIGGLVIDAGDTIGFIITAQEAVSGVAGFSYTNGGPGTMWSDSYIEITTYAGLGDGFPPASVFAGREWNGTVYYFYGASALDRSSWGAIKVGY